MENSTTAVFDFDRLERLSATLIQTHSDFISELKRAAVNVEKRSADLDRKQEEIERLRGILNSVFPPVAYDDGDDDQDHDDVDDQADARVQRLGKNDVVTVAHIRPIADKMTRRELAAKIGCSIGGLGGWLARDDDAFAPGKQFQDGLRKVVNAEARR